MLIGRGCDALVLALSRREMRRWGWSAMCTS